MKAYRSMPILYVIPQEVVDAMEAEHIPLKAVTDIDRLVRYCSAQDIVDIHNATEQFPFKFSPELEINVAPSPLGLMGSDNNHERMYNRVKGRIETAKLKGEVDDRIPAYTFKALDGKTWVAVRQRQHTPLGDPKLQLLSSNHAFFEDMIAQVLHTLAFEEMCATNLFTYYLGSYTPQQAT